LDDWSDWSHCDEHMQRYSDRMIAQVATGGGKPCTDLLRRTQSCHSPGMDCQLSEWSLWSSCDRECGGGQTERHRHIVRPPHGGGMPCPIELQEYHGCHTQPCSSHHCSLTEWSEWGDCSTHCGRGHQVRSRDLVNPNQGCGAALEEMRPCDDNLSCTNGNDCQLSGWTQWSSCSVRCGGGQRSRNRELLHAGFGGKACPSGAMKEVVPCNTQHCGGQGCTHGKWGNWDAWTPCSVSCGTGVTYRVRSPTQTANTCGDLPEGKSREEKVCQMDTECDFNGIDCAFEEWGPWGGCSADCNGFKEHTRTVKQYGSGNGMMCLGPLREVAPCSRMGGLCHSEGADVNCILEEWGSWSSCSSTCGTGQHDRSREIITHASGRGRPCDSVMREVAECRQAPCTYDGEDCMYGDWQNWQDCDKCDGHRKRNRDIIKYPSNGGAVCDVRATEQVEVCPTKCEDGATHCAWADWASWGGCTATCGSGKRVRRRQMALTVGAAPQSGESHHLQYTRLFKEVHDLQESHISEAATAFCGGCLSLAVIFLGINAFSCVRRATQHQSGALAVAPTELDAQAPLVTSGAEE